MGAMTIEADMSRPSKRFVLPYEPEYTAHRTDRRVGRTMRLHRIAAQGVPGPSLVPAEMGHERAADSTLLRRKLHRCATRHASEA
jgi:hypothetical protein